MQILHRSKVIKVGNSNMIAIPHEFCRDLMIERGDHMIFAAYSEGILTMRKLSPEEIKQMKPPEIQM